MKKDFPETFTKLCRNALKSVSNYQSFVLIEIDICDIAHGWMQPLFSCRFPSEFVLTVLNVILG